MNPSRCLLPLQSRRPSAHASESSTIAGEDEVVVEVEEEKEEGEKKKTDLPWRRRGDFSLCKR